MRVLRVRFYGLHCEKPIVSQTPRRAQETERSDILKPIPKWGRSRERPAADDPTYPSQHRLRQLRNRRLRLQGAQSAILGFLHRAQHSVIGLLDQPTFQFGPRPFHSLVSAQIVPAPRHVLTRRLKSDFSHTGDDRGKAALTEPPGGLSSSGYGYRSLRRVEFTTSKGGKFVAGPGGIDDLVSPPIVGARFVGFHAWVNADHFINALAFCCTSDAPLSVSVLNFSPWKCSYSSGVVTIDGRELIRVGDLGYDVSGVPGTRHKRGVSITTTSGRKGYLAFDGSAQLMISVFADATFEAKFAVDQGDGAVSMPIDDLAPSTSKPVLVETLVRKYAPIYMMNVDDVYWQSDVDTFLPHMIVQKVNNGAPHDFYTGPLDRNVLAQQAAALGGNNTNKGACLRTRADLNQPSDTQDWFNGARATSPAQLTTYAVVVEGEGGKLDIVYWWFFNYNQGKNVASTSWGNHVADWEHHKVHLAGVDFIRPQNERIVGIMYDHHGDQETHAPADGVAEMSGRQVIVHLANGNHEGYPRAGVYDRPMGTHDYCDDNGYRFDTRQGNIEIYSWTGSDFAGIPPGASSSYRDPAWIRYRGCWGNWTRGDLFGQVARLESGPEGIFRPGEYAQPK